MVASWTRFATDECPRCLSADIESSLIGKRCRRCGAAVESESPAQGHGFRFQGNTAQAEKAGIALNPKMALLLIFLLVVLTYVVAGRVGPNAGLENAACDGNCMTGNMASL